MQKNLFKRVVTFACVITLALIMLGAWVRLTDAGLGCPDWPGCYGKLTPHHAAEHIADAVAEQGGEHGPVSMGKAWREMIHRYLASFLGLVIVIIAAIGYVKRKQLAQPLVLPFALVGVVIMQGMFGKWTVTQDLMPIIVTTHLMGGMLTLGLLIWLWNRQQVKPRYIDSEPMGLIRPFAMVGFVLIIVQILLGGWTSTNYAALACSQLPTCKNGLWWPSTDFSKGFELFRHLGKTSSGDGITIEALTAIHLSHRIMAIVVFVFIAWLAMRVAKSGERGLGRLLALALIAQVIFGLSNVWFSLPLPVAVLHNGGAAVLVALMVTLNYRCYHARRMV